MSISIALIVSFMVFEFSKRVEALVGAIVSSVACGSRHTAIVTSKGKVYSWGDRENGVAGHSDPEGHQYTPKIIEALDNEKVTQISACGFHTGCLTEDGKVYTWGEGKFGRLGSGNERHCTSPRIVESFVGQSPTQIACGGFHSAVITADGRLATFGGGEHGQLGHGNFSNKLKPAFVKALEGVFISQISCGWSHTVALSSNGQVSNKCLIFEIIYSLFRQISDERLFDDACLRSSLGVIMIMVSLV